MAQRWRISGSEAGDPPISHGDGPQGGSRAHAHVATSGDAPSAGSSAVRSPRGGTRQARRIAHRTLVALLAAGLVVAACGSADEATGTAADEAGEPAWVDDVADSDTSGDTDDSSGPPDRGRDGAEDGGVPVTPTSATSGRRIIRTAQLVLHVDDPADAAQQVFAIADRRGGFVAETDLERDAEGVVTGTITLRIPSAQLADAVEELDQLASSVPVRRIDETDVTSEATDLEARVRNLTAYEQELTQLLADVRTTTDRPDDLLTVFERIRGVREEIERLEARLAVLSDQVALSTVSVTLHPAERALPVVDPTWSPGDQLREAFSTTTRALQGIADVTIWLVVTALPVGLTIAAPILLAVALWRRRTTSGHGAAAAPAAASGPPSEPVS